MLAHERPSTLAECDELLVRAMTCRCEAEAYGERAVVCSCEDTIAELLALRAALIPEQR